MRLVSESARADGLVLNYCKRSDKPLALVRDS